MDLSGDTVGIRLVLVVVCLGLSAFFSSSETALTTVNLIRMRNLADNGNKAACWVLKARKDQSKMLGAILIGNNVVNLPLVCHPSCRHSVFTHPVLKL